MSVLASQIDTFLEKSSWIRRMFEAGIELKKTYGQDQVYDFSLGNPDLPPPPSIKTGLESFIQEADRPYFLGYMPNGGYPGIRARLAEWLSQEQGVQITGDDVLITCGAAGGLNSLFRAVLEPGDEVICPAPYFVEYYFYANNHGAELRPVPAHPLTFHLDHEAISKALSRKTRVVLINSPNNPSGHIYSRQELEELVDLIKSQSWENNRPIYLVSDEPYRFLTFDGHQVPSILPLYEFSVVVSSFSKNLSLAGERIGYALINPGMKGKERLMDGLVFTNRVLGFVNAPALGQKLLDYALGSHVDKSIYEKRRAVMDNVLQKAGYNFTPPQGGFYFFPQAPGGDDVEFVSKLQKERVLAVPGSGFGYPGYFRMSFCVEEKTIVNAAESLTKARQKVVSQF